MNESDHGGRRAAGAPPVLELYNVRRSYRTGQEQLDVLCNLNLTLYAGDVVALIGPSGAGKSTLLHCAGLMERPNQGEIVIAGHRLPDFDDATRTRLRREHIGVVYQAHYLLREFTALENVMLAYRIAGGDRRIAHHKAQDLLERMGLEQRLNHLPAELSGGEQQRVAIARALINRPSLLLADEPTGSLDTVTAKEVFGLFTRLVRDMNIAALVATHNESLAQSMDKRLVMHAGQVHPLQ